MEEVIKKAIEGGYKPDDIQPWLNKETVLDPSFWQSLGKACWWNRRKFFHGNLDDEWAENALKFYEINLSQSWFDAVEYLKSICK